MRTASACRGTRTSAASTRNRVAFLRDSSWISWRNLSWRRSVVWTVIADFGCSGRLFGVVVDAEFFGDPAGSFGRKRIFRFHDDHVGRRVILVEDAAGESKQAAVAV